MLTPKMSGIFDCRKYDQSGKLAHDQRQMLADTDNVAFSALIPIDKVPDMFKKKITLETPVTKLMDKFDNFVVPKSSKKEREAAKAENREPVCDVVSVKFKIGANCKWFDKYAKPCARPTNAELEETRWNVQIDFTRREKNDADPLKPSGYWANCIMVAKVENNPFEGQAFEAAADEPDIKTINTADPNDTDDLPFA